MRWCVTVSGLCDKLILYIVVDLSIHDRLSHKGFLLRSLKVTGGPVCSDSPWLVNGFQSMQSAPEDIHTDSAILCYKTVRRRTNRCQSGFRLKSLLWTAEREKLREKRAQQIKHYIKGLHLEVTGDKLLWKQVQKAVSKWPLGLLNDLRWYILYIIPKNDILSLQDNQVLSFKHLNHLKKVVFEEYALPNGS